MHQISHGCRRSQRARCSEEMLHMCLPVRKGRGSLIQLHTRSETWADSATLPCRLQPLTPSIVPSPLCPSPCSVYFPARCTAFLLPPCEGLPHSSYRAGVPTELPLIVPGKGSSSCFPSPKAYRLPRFSTGYIYTHLYFLTTKLTPSG